MFSSLRFSFVLFSSCLMATAAPKRVDGIAAKAHGELVTMSELNIKLGPIQSVLNAQFPRRGPAYEAELAKIRSQILDELIDRAIIYSQFKDRLGMIPDHLVEEEVDRIVNTVYAGDEKLFRDYLRATGLSRAKFKEQQKKEILVTMVKSQHYGDLPPPSSAELRKEYNEWKLPNRDRTKDRATYQKIYLRKFDPRDPTVTPESQLTRAEELVKKLQNGADFAELAKTYSDGFKADEGGLWKDVPRTDMVHEFGFVVFETEGTEVMGPLEDRKGFTIVRVKDRDFGPAKPFAEVRDLMEKRVNDEKKKAEFEKWMAKVRKDKMIVRNL